MLGGDVGVGNPFINIVIVDVLCVSRQLVAVKAFVGNFANLHPVIITIFALTLSLHRDPMVFIQRKSNPDKAAIGT